VTTEREVSLTELSAVAPSDRPAVEPIEFGGLRRRAVTQLRLQAEDIAGRWESQVRVMMPDDTDGAVEASSGRRARALVLIRSLATALAADGMAADDAVGLGFEFGAAAFASGAALHHMLRALDLLDAMCLFALEETLGSAEDGRAVATDGIRLCRRLQQASSLSSLAASRGYMQAANDATREQYRRLRHDMRNPLGTIQGALSLMEDETVPEEVRRSPRFRAIIQRNARALDELIVVRLGDDEASSLTWSPQRLSPRAVACAVRRDLRAEADARGATVLIASTLVHHRFDAAGVELLLHEILLVLLQHARSQDVVTIAFGDRTNGRASIEVKYRPARAPLLAPEPFRAIRVIAGRLGMSLEQTDEHLVLAFPVGREEHEGPPGVASTPSAVVDGRQASDDVEGARQNEDWQSHPL
jgi:signal transduction histidine kinase